MLQGILEHTCLEGEFLNMQSPRGFHSKKLFLKSPMRPFTLTYGGNVNQTSGSTVNQGTNGNFWSIGANSSTNARNLNFNGSNVNPENNNYKSNGFSVRCVSSYRIPKPHFLELIFLPSYLKCFRYHSFTIIMFH